MKNIMKIEFANGHKYEIYLDSSMGTGSIRLDAFCYKAFEAGEFVTQNLDLNELISNLIAVENEIYRKHKELEQDTYKNSTENMEI